MAWLTAIEDAAKRRSQRLSRSCQAIRPSGRRYQLWWETTQGRRTRSSGQSPRRLTLAW